MKKLTVVLLMALSLKAQTLTPTFTVTNNLVSINISTLIYCAVRPLTLPQVQLYCYISKTATWDTLISNSMLFVDPALGTLPQSMVFDYSKGGVTTHNITFILTTTNGTNVNWQIAADGVMQTGTF